MPIAHDDLQLPASVDEIARIQSERKRVALERARTAPYYAGRLDDIDASRLDDPEVWARIPIIDKAVLRDIGVEHFEEQFFIAERGQIAEYWRSGGATGVPLYYPRTYDDMQYTFLQIRRCWAVMGASPGDLCHVSFPLGVHPAGTLMARGAAMVGIGVVWAGSGTGTPSQVQLELIRSLRPTIWIGMPSYGIHLANLADAEGFELAAGSVQRVMGAAEALSAPKREKLARGWGAEVNDLIGMTEMGILGADSEVHEGFHVWSDHFLFEVIDEESGLPQADGEQGLLVITPLFTNTATPFLRWSSGDIVSLTHETTLDGPFSVFPVMRHAQRTVGFFKVKGVNINHTEFEDFMFGITEVNDFKVELRTGSSGDELVVSIEIKRGVSADTVPGDVASAIRGTFEVLPLVEILETGTLGREFEKSIKAPRFVDHRT